MRNDPKGIFEKPNTIPMQNMVDAMRRCATDKGNTVLGNITLSHAADMMETMIDWLDDQHRALQELSK